MIEAILFDLGGVLVDVRDGEVLARLCEPPLDADVARQRWRASAAREALECGRIEPESFARRLLEEWPLGLEPARLLELAASWIGTPHAGAHALLRELRSRYRVGCLSNTSAIHWPRMRDAMGLGELLDPAVLSFEVGACKPDPAIFAHALARLGLPAGRVFFVDDVETHVRAARDAGLRAARADGPDGARRVLRAAGLL